MQAVPQLQLAEDRVPNNNAALQCRLVIMRKHLGVAKRGLLYGYHQRFDVMRSTLKHCHRRGSHKFMIDCLKDFSWVIIAICLNPPVLRSRLG